MVRTTADSRESCTRRCINRTNRSSRRLRPGRRSRRPGRPDRTSVRRRSSRTRAPCRGVRRSRRGCRSRGCTPTRTTSRGTRAGPTRGRRSPAACQSRHRRCTARGTAESPLHGARHAAYELHDGISAHACDSAQQCTARHCSHAPVNESPHDPLEVVCSGWSWIPTICRHANAVASAEHARPSSSQRPPGRIPRREATGATPRGRLRGRAANPRWSRRVDGSQRLRPESLLLAVLLDCSYSPL